MNINPSTTDRVALRDYIEARTGKRPGGNTSLRNLRKKAEAIMAREAAEDAPQAASEPPGDTEQSEPAEPQQVAPEPRREPESEPVWVTAARNDPNCRQVVAILEKHTGLPAIGTWHRKGVEFRFPCSHRAAIDGRNLVQRKGGVLSAKSGPDGLRVVMRVRP